MLEVAVAVVLAPLGIAFYAYALYPALLWLAGRTRARWLLPPEPDSWPMVSITVPVYNAGPAVQATLDHLLALDYPPDRLEIVVLSDASTDGTDDLVRTRYGPRGVQLLRLPTRLGKTAAENLAISHVKGEIVVNVDATILIPRGSLKPLIRAFGDPTVGVASGRDISMGSVDGEGNRAESGYVGYEMQVRELETRLGSIVGASGCFYGIRREVHARPLPPELSWDFASALVARELGFRSVSVTEAICIVPRTKALRTELRRKVRTMARGLSTLFYKRDLMDPMRYGSFAFMLISHKLVRWLPYLLAPFAVLALAGLAMEHEVARWLLGLTALAVASGVVAINWPHGGRPPRLLSLAGFIVTAFTAGFLAWVDAIRQKHMPTWDPTPRPDAQPT